MKRYNLFNPRRAYECFDLADLKSEFQKISLPPISIVITGGGRVAKGAMETLMGMNFKQVSADSFIKEHFNFPVFTQLNPRDYNENINGAEFSKSEFYKQPRNYSSTFKPYYQKADILVAAAYWDPVAPVLFSNSHILADDFNIKIIADITCDIDGSIPSTKKSTTILDPIYDYNPESEAILPPFSDEENLTVMAVDNLPCELPRDASIDFGNELATHVLPNFLNGDQDKILERGTIAQNNELTDLFSYLLDFVNGK